MECLTIGSSEDLTYIKEDIVKNLPPNSIRSISLSAQPSKANKMQFLNICFSDNSSSDMECHIPKGFDALMAKWIRQNYESRILRQIIMSHYGYFSRQEQAKIFRIVSDNRKALNNSSNELNAIKVKLSEYLKTSDRLYLDGFVRFRLRDYWNELETAVEEGVDEFLVQREYDEFIDLLRLFVEIQTPQVDFLHIISRKDGKYLFMDKEERDITRECTSEFIADLISEEITCSDMLLSILIIWAPTKILWHHSELENNKELIQTTQKIFGDKLTLCKDCRICKADN